MTTAEFLVSRYGFNKAWSIIADACADASLVNQTSSVAVWLNLLKAIEHLNPDEQCEFPDFLAEMEARRPWPPEPEFRLM